MRKQAEYQSEKESNDESHLKTEDCLRQAANYMEDYLRMCDLMQIIPDKFPKDIKKTHNHLVASYKAKVDSDNDAFIAAVSKEATKFIPTSEKYCDSNYMIIIPSSTRDIIQEGQNQHNCVGSYVYAVAKGESLVFFIRKKDTPEESFVTAEFRHNHLL